MPKSNPSASPKNHPKSSGDDNSARLSDVALRKKKNADAQAAFRARRANYIATLEETVTSLESVVLQLQESCREARTESQAFRQENARIRHEFREREKYWRVLWQTRKPGQNVDEVPPLPPPSSSSLVPADIQISEGSSHGVQYPGDGISYGHDETPYSGSETSYAATSPSIPLIEPDTGMNDEATSGLTKYNTYPYPEAVHGSPRNTRWPVLVNPGESGSQTPMYTESPTIAVSEMSFAGYSAEEQKPALHGVLERAPYAFSAEDRFSHRIAETGVPETRSLSPNTTPPSGPNPSLTSPFTFAFSDATLPNDRRDFDPRRHSIPHGELTLHGGTADLSTMPNMGSDAVRYHINSRKDISGPLSTLVPRSEPDTGGDRINGDDIHPPGSRLRRRRGTAPSSRSPSPSFPSMSCTVAVIKAQAFGALRRTRTRGKKTSEGAAKVAMDVLEARGIGIGGPSTSSKRQRLGTDNDDVES